MRWLVMCLLVITACAGGDKPDRPGSDAGTSCVSDSDCNDGIGCTVDSCGAGNLCRFMPVDALCAAGESCSPTLNCTTTMSCSMDSECDDGIECTLDSCGSTLTCRYMPVDALCEAGETCDAVMGCVPGSGCADDSDCDDAIDCTVDRCGVGNVCSHEAVDALCADGESCSETAGCFTPMPCETAEDCQDGNFCNGAEVCMPEFGCAPAPAARMCADTDDCTIDSCDATADMCVFACDTSRAECECPVAAPTCTGTFMLSPGVTYSCPVAGVSFDFSRATFAIDSGYLTVTPTSSSFAPLTDTMDPVCPMFDAESVVSGGCEEHYRLYGSFTDDDHFSGTLEVRFVDVDGFSCALAGCAERTMAVTGTRIP